MLDLALIEFSYISVMKIKDVKELKEPTYVARANIYVLELKLQMFWRDIKPPPFNI